MLTALKRFFLPILLLMVYSCQNDGGSDKKSVGTDTVPEYSLRTGDTDEIANVSGELSSLDVIQLSSEVSEAIGDVFQFAVIDSVGILIVNFYAETVCLVDFSGNLRWKIVPRDDDFRYYQSMEGCTYDMFSKRVLMYNQQKTYFFDLEGNPVAVQLRACLKI